MKEFTVIIERLEGNFKKIEKEKLSILETKDKIDVKFKELLEKNSSILSEKSILEENIESLTFKLHQTSTNLTSAETKILLLNILLSEK